MTLKKIICISIFAILIIATFFIYHLHNEHIVNVPQDVIYREDTVEIRVSSCPLKEGSLSVESLFNKNNLSLWTQRQHGAAYHLLQNTAALWRENESIEDFMVIGTIPPRMQSDNFFWEIMPFSQNRFNRIELFKVVWHLIFNNFCLSKEERRQIQQKYHRYLNFFGQPYQPIPPETSCNAADAFCRPEVIQSQILYSGKRMDILYNYAPIGVGDEKIHFLIIPQEHRRGFPELTLEEYLESQEMTVNLLEYYEKKGFPVAYIFHKTGEYAGQTVPHWHLHVVFASSQVHEFLGKLQILVKQLIFSHPLSKDQLELLVNKYREQVKEAMQQQHKVTFSKEIDLK